MIAPLLALLLLQTTGALPPLDWSGLPTIRYARPVADDAQLANFVRTEVAAGRCAAARPAAAGGWTLAVDVAVLMQADGTARRTLPRAIGCPAVEQYAAGIVFSRVRANLDTAVPTGEGWYRTTMTFAWR